MTSAEAALGYADCERIARSEAKHFYWAFRFLPRERRLGMSAVYAFARRADDLADGGGTFSGGIEERRRRIQNFRDDLRATLAGQPANPAMAALADTVARFSLTPSYLEMILDGTEQDLSVTRYQTFDALKNYCRLVASSIGLLTVELIGCREEQAKPLAEQMGVAFQLTNILRDVREDAGRGRIYLPQEDLAAAGCPESDILNGVTTDAFLRVCAVNAARARRHYESAYPLLQHLSLVARRTVAMMAALYSLLLHRIESGGFRVLERRVTLSRFDKTFTFLGILFRPDYSVRSAPNPTLT